MIPSAPTRDRPGIPDRRGPVRTSAGVQSVERALDVLEVLAGAPAPLGVSDIATASGLADGTVHRLLRTLVTRGFARQGPDRRYALGTRLLALGDAARRALVVGAGAILERLVAQTGETANLAVLEGDSVVYVAQAPSPHRLRLFAEVGRHVPVHSTAVGKVLLSGLPEGEARAVLDRAGLPARTRQTLTAPDAVVAEVNRTRGRGYAIDDGEEETGVRCVAVPVLDGGTVVAAVSVSGPAARVVVPPAAGLLAALHEAAAALASAPGRP